jgi:regulator of RNase E activity RraB
MTDDDDDAAQLEGDRATVAALTAQGDPLIKPRLVDHWIYFETAEDRDRFVDEVSALGFTITDTHGDADPPRRFCANVSRITSVDLESIHQDVMRLFRSAKRHDGDYDGWEFPIETAESNRN